MIDRQNALSHALENDVAPGGFETQALDQFTHPRGHAAQGLIELGGFPSLFRKGRVHGAFIEHVFREQLQTLNAPLDCAGKNPGHQDRAGSGQAKFENRAGGAGARSAEVNHKSDCGY